MKRKILLFLLGISIALGMSVLRPRQALADDGFIGGLQDLVGVRQVDELTGYEDQYTRNYTPVLRDGNSEEDVQEVTTDQAIQDVVNQANTVTWTLSSGNSSFTLLRSVRMILGQGHATLRDRIIVTAVGFVFLWWGLRKSIRVVMASFRKGRASL